MNRNFHGIPPFLDVASPWADTTKSSFLYIFLQNYHHCINLSHGKIARDPPFGDIAAPWEDITKSLLLSIIHSKYIQFIDISQ